MDELIDRIATAVGTNRETAREAVLIILGFLRSEGPADKVDGLIAEMGGGAEGAVAAEPAGGGTMAVLGRLQGAGLGMGQIQGVTKEVVDYARETVGGDEVDEIVDSIPGLRQFL